MDLIGRKIKVLDIPGYFRSKKSQVTFPFEATVVAQGKGEKRDCVVIASPDPSFYWMLRDCPDRFDFASDIDLFKKVVYVDKNCYELEPLA